MKLRFPAYFAARVPTCDPEATNQTRRCHYSLSLSLLGGALRSHSSHSVIARWAAVGTTSGCSRDSGLQGRGVGTRRLLGCGSYSLMLASAAAPGHPAAAGGPVPAVQPAPRAAPGRPPVRPRGTLWPAAENPGRVHDGDCAPPRPPPGRLPLLARRTRLRLCSAISSAVLLHSSGGTRGHLLRLCRCARCRAVAAHTCHPLRAPAPPVESPRRSLVGQRERLVPPDSGDTSAAQRGTGPLRVPDRGGGARATA